MKLRPEGQKVLVEVDKVKEWTSGGLILPKTAIKNRQYMLTIGTVVAIGPTTILNFNVVGDEKADDEIAKTRGLRIGDKIWFAKYGGCEFEYNSVEDKLKDGSYKDLRMINDSDVMAIVDDDISNEKEVI